MGTLPSEYTLLGNGDLRDINSTAAMKSAWLSEVGYSPNGDTLNDLLFDHLTTGSDPTGDTPTMPLMPTIEGNLDVILGGHSRIKRATFRYGSHSHTNKVQAALHLQYREMRADIQAGRIPVDHDRKVLDAWLEKYRISKTDPSMWKRLIPPELRAGHRGPLPHSTMVSDNFNRSNESLDAGSWTEVTNDWSIVSEEAALITDNANSSARYTTALSSSDNYGQADLITASGGGTIIIGGPACRFKASADTYYFVFFGKRGDNELSLRKLIAGTPTSLSEQNGTFSSPDTLKVTANGNSQEAFLNGVSQLTAGDTAIGSGIHGGLYGGKFTSGTLTFDNFEAADLSPSSTTGVKNVSPRIFQSTVIRGPSL